MMPRDRVGGVNPWVWLMLAVVAVSVFFLARAARDVNIVASSSYVADTSHRPECPHTPFLPTIDSVRKQQVMTSVVPLSGPTTDIPEFHDCQRFIVDSAGKDVYGSLYAIYASSGLDTLVQHIDTLQEPSIHPEYRGKIAAVPAATVYSYGGTPDDPSTYDGGVYDALKIQPSWNCLYLWRQRHTDSWRAWMINQGLNNKCSDPVVIDPANAPPGELKVTPVLVKDSVPRVARWDWDANKREQYVGIACGHAWCEVSKDGDLSAQATPAVSHWESVDGLSMDPPGAHAVIGVKGWYDAQRLALPGPNGRPYPSDIWGVVVPHPTLGQQKKVMLQTMDAQHRWVHVATAVVSRNYDGQVLKLKAGQENKIYLCDPAGGPCPGVPTGMTCPAAGVSDPSVSEWLFSKVTYFRSVFFGLWHVRVSTYYCEAKRDASATPRPKIPGTARWRWLANDETTWKSCDPGCCESRPR